MKATTYFLLILLTSLLAACAPATAQPTQPAVAKAQVIPPADGRLWGVKTRATYDLAESCQDCSKAILVTRWDFYATSSKICPAANAYFLGPAEQIRYNRRGDCEILNEPVLMYSTQGEADRIEKIAP